MEYATARLIPNALAMAHCLNARRPLTAPPRVNGGFRMLEFIGRVSIIFVGRNESAIRIKAANVCHVNRGFIVLRLIGLV